MSGGHLVNMNRKDDKEVKIVNDKSRMIILIVSACVTLSALAGERRISAVEYRDRMEAAWLGQMIGVAWGNPVEFHFQGNPVPEDKLPHWTEGLVNDALGQDDIYVELTFVRTMEKYGYGVSIRQAGIDFANSTYGLCHANHAGRRNLRAGIAPPASSHPFFNECANDIDYQIEADYSGILAPGLPQAAISMGEKFGRLMNYGDGLYGGQFVGALYAAAFFETDPERIVEAALKAIPAGSRYAEMVRDVLAWHRAHPQDFAAVWRLIAGKYRADRGCNQQNLGSGINAVLNGAFVLTGLLYGEKDIGKTCLYAIRGGWDTDCNASSACGVLCTTLGRKGIDARYTAKLDRTKKFVCTDYTFDELIVVSEKLARDVIVANGGRIEKDDGGMEWFVLPEKDPDPSPCVSFYAPGPVEGGRYTQDEIDQIRFQPFNGTGFQMAKPSVPK